MSAATVYRLRPGWRLQWEEAQRRHVLLYPEGMVQLNESAGAILALVDGERALGEIIADLERCFPEAEGVASDVKAFLQEACQQGWIREVAP